MDLKKLEVFHALDPVFLSDVNCASLIRFRGGQDMGKILIIIRERKSEDYDKIFFGFYVIAESKPRGGILVMKNDDVYSVVRDKDDLILLGVPDYSEALPMQAVKIKTLCGKGIIRKHSLLFMCSIHCIKVKQNSG